MKSSTAQPGVLNSLYRDLFHPGGFLHAMANVDRHLDDISNHLETKPLSMSVSF